MSIVQDLPTPQREYKPSDPNVRLADERFDPAIGAAYRHFLDYSERAHRASDDNHNALQNARRTRDEAKRRREFFIAECADRNRKPPQAESKAHDIAVAEADKAYRAAHRRPKPFHIDVNALDNFGRKLDPDKVQVAESEEIESFESLTDQLEEATAQVEAERQQLAHAEMLPRDRKSIFEKAKRDIAALKERGPKTQYGSTDDFDDNGSFRPRPVTGGMKWPTIQARPPGGGGGIEVIDTVGLLMWLFPEEFGKKLMELVEATTPDNGVTLETKIKRVSEAQARVAAALRKENAILMALEARGELFHRKRHYHPAVMLGVQWSAQKIAEF